MRHQPTASIHLSEPNLQGSTYEGKSNWQGVRAKAKRLGREARSTKTLLIVKKRHEKTEHFGSDIEFAISTTWLRFQHGRARTLDSWIEPCLYQSVKSHKRPKTHDRSRYKPTKLRHQQQQRALRSCRSQCELWHLALTLVLALETE